MAKKDETGRHGEVLAARWLEDHGLTVVELNWRCREGEIDVVALDGDEVVVVEVKTRRGIGWGHPLEAVTAVKLARLRRLAGAWLEAHPGAGRRVRIDVVGVVLGRAPGDDEISHVRGAGA
ncbi:YraN family protein [Frigoribacterium sp. CFBP 13729]|uniref:YraN family protein n=1 Tax=unclassified Frigoribacterium TaxID=2627005 RepID=UPI00177B77C7|nr:MULTISPECIES: YraN family protein [unclassified Frigoribacterium]MBD8584826.1 YraN family protein [Frigoribacterium sp. CFBP 8766]MBD8609585.1 YraN family protein [Frigoribacterium sp. CFBP 13729]